MRFLKAYYVMFNRITFGASRLQEVMADRVAVNAYGAPAFERGLKHVIRRDLETTIENERRIQDAVMGKDALREGEPDRFSPLMRQRSLRPIKSHSDDHDRVRYASQPATTV